MALRQYAISDTKNSKWKEWSRPIDYSVKNNLGPLPSELFFKFMKLLIEEIIPGFADYPFYDIQSSLSGVGPIVPALGPRLGVNPLSPPPWK